MNRKALFLQSYVHFDDHGFGAAKGSNELFIANRQRQFTGSEGDFMTKSVIRKVRADKKDWNIFSC